MEWLDTWIRQAWWVLPVMILLARVVDVTLGTLRVIFVSRGHRILAPVCGFFEVLIWITAITQIIRNMDNAVSFVAYAAGYALGTFVGMRIEARLALGNLMVRVITQGDAEGLVLRLRQAQYRVTSLNAEGARGPVKIVFTVVRRSQLPKLLHLVRTVNPRAFYTVEDVRGIHEAIQPYRPATRPPRRPGK